ncbi:MAG: UDP-N-acetylmuramoyl-L-alanyl-D-glutamate--2,6-diaminopimelate ligase [Patescibacteria group bacterium]
MKSLLRRMKTAIAPWYHGSVAHLAAWYYGYPSRRMKVIGVTGTKGKSTVVLMLAHILEAAGHRVASIGSLGTRIGSQSWPNTLKMTMPGRFYLQRFLARAREAQCEYVVMEVTSEGLAQNRHYGVSFDCAVFTNLHPEHIESHGSLDRYREAKEKLFAVTTGVHVINANDAVSESFAQYPAQRTIFFGIDRGDIRASHVSVNAHTASFQVFDTQCSLQLGGRFMVMNALAAIATAAMYDIDVPTSCAALGALAVVPGRMQYIQRQPFSVVVDYAHTPDSLRAVYETLKPQKPSRLIVVLGAAGGGRDTWKRSQFGVIAGEHASEIVLTNEDPYDEDPDAIVHAIHAGIPAGASVRVIMDRGQAIRAAIRLAQTGDVVVITGKGSETSIAGPHGLRVPWSDVETAQQALRP